MVTARDVADRLGIAVSTVGRALADDPRISQATKQRVHDAANDMGYVSQLAARMLRGEPSRLIGLLIPDVRNNFYASIAHALTTICDERGYRVVLAITDDDPAIEQQHIHALAAAQASGVVIVPTATPSEMSKQLLGNIPHVQLLRHSDGLAPFCFLVDDVTMMQSAAAYVTTDCGHREVAYIGGRQSLSTGRDRLNGVRQGLAPGAALDVHLGDTTIEGGQQAIRDTLDAGKPTVVIVGSALMSSGVLFAAQSMGLRIPHDLSLVAFGDPDWYQFWTPPLATIRPPVANLAEVCAQWLIERLESQTSDAHDQYTHVEAGDLVIRESIAILNR